MIGVFVSIRMVSVTMWRSGAAEPAARYTGIPADARGGVDSGAGTSKIDRAMDKAPAIPPAVAETPRQAIGRILADGPHTAYELSALVHLREKDVVPHLEHLARSLRRTDRRLDVEPASCRDCGYAFRDRTRLGRPSSCPRCDGQHVSAPVFRVVARR
jgi:predicted Zn-ribbon and HTH transcriptional regulator